MVVVPVQFDTGHSGHVNVGGQPSGIRKVAQSWEIGAQQPHKVPRIAFLTTASPPGSQYTHAFIRGLADLGRVEGHNIWRWGRGSTEQFPRYAVEGLNVDVHRGREQFSGLSRQERDQNNSHRHCDYRGPGARRIRHEPRSPERQHLGLNLQTPACRAQACLSYQNCL